MPTTAPVIGLFVSCTLFAGAMLGLLIGKRLPPHHLNSETRSVVSAAMAVVGTMSALVIGLMISNGSTAFKMVEFFTPYEAYIIRPKTIA